MTMKAKDQLKAWVDKLTEGEAQEILDDISHSEIEWISVEEAEDEFGPVKDELSSAFKRMSD